MITGSHNPPEYNGFKITILKKPFYGDDIRTLGEKITQNLSDFSESNAEFSADLPKIRYSPQNPQIQKLRCAK